MKLETIRAVTLSIMCNLERVLQTELKAFYAVKYQKRQVLEIVLGLSQKVISNYTNHISNTPITATFHPFYLDKSK